MKPLPSLSPSGWTFSPGSDRLFTLGGSGCRQRFAYRSATGELRLFSNFTARRVFR
jgi:hypothetical protein